MIGFFAQCLLGVYSHLSFNASRTLTPLQDKIHWYAGRIICILALANLYMGLQELYDHEGRSLPIIYPLLLTIWILFICALFWRGERMYGQTHHQEQVQNDVDHRNGMLLSNLSTEFEGTYEDDAP
jgi:hypothetical protein